MGTRGLDDCLIRDNNGEVFPATKVVVSYRRIPRNVIDRARKTCLPSKEAECVSSKVGK